LDLVPQGEIGLQMSLYAIFFILNMIFSQTHLTEFNEFGELLFEHHFWRFSHTTLNLDFSGLYLPVIGLWDFFFIEGKNWKLYWWETHYIMGEIVGLWDGLEAAVHRKWREVIKSMKIWR
jgi:hypothetical protein